MRALNFLLAYFLILAGAVQAPGMMLTAENGNLTYVICEGNALTSLTVPVEGEEPGQSRQFTLCDACLSHVAALTQKDTSADCAYSAEAEVRYSGNHQPPQIDTYSGILGSRAPPVRA